MRRGIVALAAALLLAGCVSSKTTTTNPAPSGPGGASSVPAAEKAHVGDSIELDASNGDHVTVTLIAVKGHVRATDGFSHPDRGKRYAAAQVSIEMPTGAKEAYDDSPSNGAAVLTTDGESFDADLPTDTTAGHALDSVRITPGRTVKGWLVFQVPRAARLDAFQFSLESGFGNGGEWQIP